MDQSVLGKQKPETYNLAIRKRILETRGVKSILSFNTTVDTTTRRVMFSAEIDSLWNNDCYIGGVMALNLDSLGLSAKVTAEDQCA